MKIIGMALLIIIAGAIQAADDKGNYAIWGAGTKSCQAYNQARGSHEDAKYKDYLMGYFTAYNYISDHTYSISSQMTIDEILAWVDEQCELKPTVSFDQVLTSFLLEHYENRLKYPPGGGFR